MEPSDPESVINELEASCTETHLSANQGLIAQSELFDILVEVKLRGNMTRPQFEKSVSYVREAKPEVGKEAKPTGKDKDKEDDMVSEESLIKSGVPAAPSRV